MFGTDVNTFKVKYNPRVRIPTKACSLIFCHLQMLKMKGDNVTNER